MRYVFGLIMAALAAGGLAAQGPGGGALTVTARTNLDFGQMMAGIATYIGPDANQAGQFEIRGTRNLEVQVQLTLPFALTLPTGEQMPVSFGTADGLVSRNSNPRNGTAFDPSSPLLWRLPPNGRSYVFVGGTAQPTPVQRSGIYTGIITLTVGYTGN